MAHEGSPGPPPPTPVSAGNTPLISLQRLNPNPRNTVLLKLEGNNPAGSVKDRPALSMIKRAEESGRLSPGQTLIEATSGNTGIALAMAAAIRGYPLKLIMPSNMTEERKASMAAYGAQLIEVGAGAMEEARDLALAMQERGEGVVLDQFANTDNPRAHVEGTGPELWEQTGGRLTHFVSSMGTTGTIMGVSEALSPKGVRIVGLQPKDGNIPGIRRWPEEYLPKIFDRSRVDEVIDITQRESQECMRALARCEGVLAGVSSGGAVSAALRVSAAVDDAVIAVIVCDRGDRYLSSGLLSAEAGADDPAPVGVAEHLSALALLGTAHPGPHYVYVSSGRYPDDHPEHPNEPWCGDCRRSLPAARAAVVETGGTLLVVEAGTREEWKGNDAHPLRQPLREGCTFGLASVQGLPTLLRWGASPTGGGAELARCGPELEAAETEADAARIVGEFIESTKGLSL